MFVALQRSWRKISLNLRVLEYNDTRLLPDMVFETVFCGKSRTSKMVYIKVVLLFSFQLLQADKNDKAYTYILKLSSTCQIVLISHCLGRKRAAEHPMFYTVAV